MDHNFFRGTCTALVTPFLDDKINYPMAEILIKRQLDAGIRNIVLSGTTGEAPTLSDDEKITMFKRAKDFVGDDMCIIAGTGSNDTAYAVELTKCACDLGYDGMLVVTPYYNKATQNGLIKMFTTIADASTVPVVLYNVPGRTGCNLLPTTVAKLADHPNIVGIKEASGNISQIVKLMTLTDGNIDLYSGNDDQVVPLMSMGGLGVISVVSNIAPRAVHDMCDKMLKGDVKGAAQIQKDTLDLCENLFSEVNPIPAKAGVSAMGFGEENLRLPLTPMEDATRAVLFAEMRKLGINV